MNNDPPLRRIAAEKLIRNVIHEDGGPLIYNGWEDEQRSFRFYLPEVLPFPHSTPTLSLLVTHRFPGRAKNVEVQARLLELQTATAERVVATMVLDTNARVAMRSSAPVGVVSTSNRKPPLRNWSGHYPAGTNCQGFSMRIRRQ